MKLFLALICLLIFTSSFSFAKEKDHSNVYIGKISDVWGMAHVKIEGPMSANCNQTWGYKLVGYGTRKNDSLQRQFSLISQAYFGHKRVTLVYNDKSCEILHVGITD